LTARSGPAASQLQSCAETGRLILAPALGLAITS